MKILPVANLHIASSTKQAVLDGMFRRIEAGEQTTVVTPYSEFLFASLHDGTVATMVNSFTFAVPDGVGLLWAKAFLDIPFRTKRYPLRVVEAFVHVIYTLLRALVAPRFLYTAFPEKIPGSQLVWDIAQRSAVAGKSIFLLGGFGDTPERAAAALTKRVPSLRIAGTCNLDYSDERAVAAVKASGADVVLVAYGPITQERWILKHKDQLGAKLLVGLGGTFDYLAGVHRTAPNVVSNLGLEWLWRLVTQPHRMKRIWNATAGLVVRTLKYKLFSTLPYRPNVMVAALDGQGRVLVGKRAVPKNKSEQEKFANYWQLPQGGTDGEELSVAALRELREETGVTSAQVLSAAEHTYRYDWPVTMQSMWHPRYRGTEQAAVFLSAQHPSEAAADNDEFTELRWVPLEEVADFVHPERRPAVAPLVAEALRHGYR